MFLFILYMQMDEKIRSILVVIVAIWGWAFCIFLVEVGLNCSCKNLTNNNKAIRLTLRFSILCVWAQLSCEPDTCQHVSLGVCSSIFYSLLRVRKGAAWLCCVFGASVKEE